MLRKREEKRFEADQGQFPQVLSWMDAFLSETDCGAKERMQLDLILEELLVNVASYAYGEDGGTVLVTAELETAEKVPESGNAPRLTVSFSDSGIPFNPLEREDPKLSGAAEERTVGGLGVYLVKKLSDCLSYERVDGKNILTFQKTLSSAFP